MTAMWKPGTAKPQQQQQHQSDGVNVTNDNASTSDTNKQPTAKKLSTATMGMRFMQRKSLDSNKSKNNSSPKNKTDGANNVRPINNSVISSAATSFESTDRKRDISAISSSSPSPLTNTTSTILELATTIDIYGPTSDIIGRRSFNGFHKSISSTWEEAYRKRTESASETNGKGNKGKISDEELLKRYERYVKEGKKKSGVADENKRKRKSA
jgi:hypothetical protein